MSPIRLFRSIFFAAGVLACLAFISPAAGRGQTPRPDLVVTQLAFEKISQGTDASGHSYWIFNVIVSVKNQGAGAAAASKLLLERNNGTGGAYQLACPTCLIDVAAIPAGGSLTLPPRQFNNADNAPSMFRATIDSQHAVAEANESNNALTAVFQASAIELDSKILKTPGGKIPMLKPDLTVVGMDFVNVKTSVAGGITTYTFDVVATIKNLGPGAAPDYGVVFQQAPVNDPKGSVPAPNGFQLCPPLPANGTATARIWGLTWTSGTPRRIYSIDVDYQGKIDEVKEDNNHSEKTTPWNAPMPSGAPIRPGA